MLARMKSPTARNALVLLSLIGLTVAACLLASSDPTILGVLPALALALMLALKRYPGERVLLVLRADAGSRRQRPRASVPAGTRRDRFLPRGSQLLGCALAVRPPPAALPAAA